MNVYVESNFVLELALRQEQFTSCERILSLCEEGRIRLVVPAYSLAEPYDTLTRRERQRKGIKVELDRELGQMVRTASHASRLDELQGLSALLINVTHEEIKRFQEVRSRLLETAEIIPLDLHVMTSSAEHQRVHGFSPQDALVYSSVRLHLERAHAERSCFLNRNSRDFDDENVVEELRRHNCKMLFRFDTGCQFILNALRLS